MPLIRVGLAFCFLVTAGAVPQEAVPGPNAGTDPASRPVRLAGGVIAGNIIKKVAPQYPQAAKDKHISGSVILHAFIGKDGKIENLTVISGPKELQKSSLDAVKHWTYRPYLLNGLPTEVDTTITVNYNFAGGPMPPMAPMPEDEPEPTPVLKPFDLRTLTPPPGYVQISGGVMAGMLVHKIDPVYPDTDASGYVVMAAEVSKDGSILGLQAVSGPAPLRSAALAAVKQWRYRPYLLNGEPTAVQTTITVAFTR